jgi:hypothetical protein
MAGPATRRGKTTTVAFLYDRREKPGTDTHGRDHRFVFLQDHRGGLHPGDDDRPIGLDALTKGERQNKIPPAFRAGLESGAPVLQTSPTGLHRFVADMLQTRYPAAKYEPIILQFH